MKNDISYTIINIICMYLLTLFDKAEDVQMKLSYLGYKNCIVQLELKMKILSSKFAV